jgi:DNA-directed RNA polymerase alpha subunit
MIPKPILKPRFKQIKVQIVNDYQFKYGKNLYTKVSYEKIPSTFEIPQKHIFVPLNKIFDLSEEIGLDDFLKNLKEKPKSVRVFNLLYRQGIYSLKDLGRYSINDLMSIKGMGKQSADSIYKILCLYYSSPYLLTESDTDEEHY